MAETPILNLSDPTLAPYVFVKTNIGGWFFDAYTRENHESKLDITQHPVQTGAAVSDHAFLQPKTLTMDIAMSDVATSYIAGQFDGTWSRSRRAFDVLMELQALRLPLQITTRLKLYSNMLIETISAPDDYETLTGLKCTITFKELLVAMTQTAKISERPHVTDTNNRGNVPTKNPTDTSIIKKFTQALTGVST